MNIVPVKKKGVSVSNGKRAVTLAVIKQADENMDKMKKSSSRDDGVLPTGISGY